MKSELEKFYTAIESIETAMMTTRRSDGHLRSRAMANQKRAAGADLWFVCREGTAKLADLAQRSTHQPVVLPRQQPRMDLGVRHGSDLARSRQDPELYAPDWKMWFGEEGDRATARPTIRASC